MRTMWIAGAVLLLCAGIAVPQALRVNVQLHQMIVTVTDDRGSYVTDLKPEDFVLEVDGNPHKIDLFTQDADTPVTLGLLIDTSGSMAALFGPTRQAARAFIESFRPGDEFFVATFAGSLHMRQGLTQDKSKLSDALSGLTAAYGSTHLLHAVESGLEVTRKGRNRKRAMVIITDGMDTTCPDNLQPFKTAIRKSETLMYGIRMPAAFTHMHSTTLKIVSHCKKGPGANDFFAALEDETGGRTFTARPGAGHFDEQLADMFETISMELRGQYTIGAYYDDPSSATPKTVRIRTTHSGYRVRATHPTER
jgi:Ca-activated chloride channel homolog